MKKTFRVLLVYPNIPGMLVISVAIGLFTRLLRDAGFEVELFDATLHTLDKSVSPLKRVEFAQARKFSYEKDLGIELHSDLIESFVHQVEQFKPDLLAISLVEDAVHQCLLLLDAVKDKNIPHIVGGIFPTSAPDMALENPQINRICLGEGEEALLELAQRLRDGKPTDSIKNTWVKKNDGTIIKNPIGQPLDINTSVIPDYSLFEEKRFYRPMGGKILKTIPLEMYRGCPYQCTFCCSPMWDKFYKQHTHHVFHRRKTIDRVIAEVDYLVQQHHPELLYIIDDTFLARPIEEIESFVAAYKPYCIPFWMNTRPETITEYKMKLMKEINCYRISIGMECGDEQFRQTVLKRHISNQEFPKRMEILRKSGIPFSINNIIGFPGETRDLIFKTIELNRRIKGYDSITVSIFTPYHGSELRDRCINEGYLDKNSLTGHTTMSSMLAMPQLTSEEIDGLMRTFCMYVKFPKTWWPYIEEAELFTPQGNNIFTTLNTIYHDVFFSKNQYVHTQNKIDWNNLEQTILKKEVTIKT
jgi:anaerobic magnesium-protoporphyrin IX monomethyl ester cyclase